mgnify:CR=1 FL=1
MKILVFIQNDDNHINRMTLEAISGAQHLLKIFSCDSTSSISVATFNKNSCAELEKLDLEKIILIENKKLEKYNPLYYTSAMEQLLTNNPEIEIVLFAHTYEARDWVPRLSARLDIPFITDCIGFKECNNKPCFIRQTYQGKINNDISTVGTTLCSIQSGSFKTDNLNKGTPVIEKFSVELENISNTIHTEKKFKEQQGGVDLTAAEVIVSVGRGIGKEENLPMVEELSELLGAELGSSRPVVDYGWLAHERQIGSSGQVVSPKLYFAIGISGAIQHQVGMKSSNHIMSINKDPNAPIFEISNYAVIGDLLEIVPKVIKKLKEI